MTPDARLYEIRVWFWLAAILLGGGWFVYEANRGPDPFEARLACLRFWAEAERAHERFSMTECEDFMRGAR